MEKMKASVALAFKSADTLQEQEEFLSNLKQMIFWSIGKMARESSDRSYF